MLGLAPGVMSSDANIRRVMLSAVFGVLLASLAAWQMLRWLRARMPTPMYLAGVIALGLGYASFTVHDFFSVSHQWDSLSNAPFSVVARYVMRNIDKSHFLVVVPDWGARDVELGYLEMGTYEQLTAQQRATPPYSVITVDELPEWIQGPARCSDTVVVTATIFDPLIRRMLGQSPSLRLNNREEHPDRSYRAADLRAPGEGAGLVTYRLGPCTQGP